jgi:hypothetical protein
MIRIQRLSALTLASLAAATLIACTAPDMTSTDQPSSTMTNEQRAAARASVNIVDCTSKPYFDTISASDHTTVIKGMTPIEREVCSEFNRNGQQDGR